jgi:hypothetical protein
MSKQLVKAAGAVGPSHIEANESLSKKDFVIRIKYAARNQKRALID